MGIKVDRVAALVATSVFFLSGVAYGQDDVVDEEMADESAEEMSGPEEPMEEEPAEETNDEAGSDEEVAEDSAGSEDKGDGRFRFGVSGLGGPMVGAFSGSAGGVDMRFGWQLNNDYGIYAQPTLIIAAGAAADADEVSASVAALAGTGVLFEWNPINFVYLGGGLGVLTGGFGSAGVTADSAEAKAATGPFFAIPLRAGLALGSNEPNRRKAFTIGLDAHIVVTGAGPVILPLLALGYDAF